MSLDIAVLDESGAPTAIAAIGVDEHWALLELAKEHNLRLWMRMSDYYEDVEFAPEDVRLLLEEVFALQTNCTDAKLLENLKAVEVVLRRADEQRVAVSAIAD